MRFRDRALIYRERFKNHRDTGGFLLKKADFETQPFLVAATKRKRSALGNSEECFNPGITRKYFDVCSVQYLEDPQYGNLLILAPAGINDSHHSQHDHGKFQDSHKNSQNRHM